MKKIAFIFATLYCVLVNAQTYQWAKGIGGTGNNNPNTARSVTTDVVGNVYMTGSFGGTNVNFNPGQSPVILNSANNSQDIFFAKYNASGNCTWAKGIVGAAGTGQSIAVDASGNVFIAGFFQGTNVDFDPGTGTALLSSAGLYDIFFAKYDAGGNYLWAKSMGGSVHDWATSISIGATGNVYLTGRFQSTTVDFDPGLGVANLSPTGNIDLFFAKYDTNGNYLWAKSVGGPGDDISYSISTDAAGNAYITGNFSGTNVDFDPGSGVANLSAATVTTSLAMFFAKYDTNGNYLWAKSVFGVSYTSGQSISVDAAGNAWITGLFDGTSVDFDPGPGIANLSVGTSPTGSAMFFGKYDPNGNYLWAKSVPGAGGYAITRNAFGKIYIIGNFSVSNVDFDPGPGTAILSPAGTSDFFFAKYDAVGNYIWAKSLGGPLDDFGMSIAVDGTDNAYIAGSFYGTNVDFDPGPSTAPLSTSGFYNMYLARYALCTIQVPNPRVICAGNSYAFNGHTYTASGIYNDTLNTALGCDSVVVTQLTVSSQQPTVTISSSSVLCTGSTNTLTAGGAVTYTWNTGAVTPVVVVTPTNGLQIAVIGTGSNGCTASNTINVLSSPAFNLIGFQTICKGENIVITASGANNYTWSSGAQTQSISATLTTTTVYTVTGSFTNTLCKTRQTTTVNVTPCLRVNSNDTGAIQMTVYPNPANTELFYTVNSNGPHRYTLTDLSGRVLEEGEQRSGKARLDLSIYQPGLYILTISVGRVSKSLSVLIE